MRHEPSFNTTLPANGIKDTGPPESLRPESQPEHLSDDALCARFLDMLILDDLKKNIISEANEDSRSYSGELMAELVADLKGNPDAAAIDMLDLLKRLGLKLALNHKVE
jgi:hypothetical protein